MCAQTLSPPPPKLPTANKPKRGSFEITRGAIKTAQRIGIYGPGGIGKTSLAAMLPKAAFVDLDEGSNRLDVARLSDANGSNLVKTWADLRAALADNSLWKDCKSVIIDSATRAEELAVAHTVATVKHEKGHTVKRLEDYGYGKGYSHLYDTFLQLFADLDRHIRAGRNVVLICHECTANVPNPGGEDYIRYEPRLSAPASGKSSIRHRLKEWCDHLFYIGYDVFTVKGKAQGSSERQIYPVEMPTHWAKSRSLAEPIEYEKDSPELWNQLFE